MGGEERDFWGDPGARGLEGFSSVHEFLRAVIKMQSLLHAEKRPLLGISVEHHCGYSLFPLPACRCPGAWSCGSELKHGLTLVLGHHHVRWGTKWEVVYCGETHPVTGKPCSWNLGSQVRRALLNGMGKQRLGAQYQALERHRPSSQVQGRSLVNQVLWGYRVRGVWF